MSTADATTPLVIRPRWTRAFRPLVWWGLLVLCLYGYRTHERLLQQTRIVFSVDLQGQRSPTDPTVRLDGEPVQSGELITLGRHTFTVSHPKGEPYSANLFVWYGEQNLGPITLKRTTGLLSLAVDPPAPLLSITGPEFKLTLTNSSGMTSSVPTDRYLIEARYAHWLEKTDVTVTTGANRSRITPKLGSIEVSCNQPDATFRLLATGERLITAGSIPVTIRELPVGQYRVIAKRGDYEVSNESTIAAGKTNQLAVEFLYGTAVLESEPPGAAITGPGGRSLGTTPQTLAQLKQGTWEFQLRSREFETVMASLIILADQTNVFRTNLVSRQYTTAMTAARRYFADRNYVRAAEAAAEALKHKQGDLPAIQLRREAGGHAHLVQADGMAQRGDLPAAVKELKAALELIPGNVEAEQLLARYTGQIQQREEVEARRLKAEREAEERQVRMREVFERLDFNSKMHLRGATFPRNDLLATNEVKVIGEAIHKAMKDAPPVFQIARYTWDQPDAFVIETKQILPDGSRECVIVGAQVSATECLISFKVLEYPKSNSVSILGGLATAQITTQADRDGTRAARFQKQVEEGVPMVRERIQASIAQIQRSP